MTEQLPTPNVSPAPTSTQAPTQTPPIPEITVTPVPTAAETLTRTQPTPEVGVSSVPTPTQTPTKTTPTPDSPALTDLKRYVLGLINQDRADHGIGPVRLGNNLAAQSHAEDMVKNFYIAHWDSGGMKPYMRYTQAGGQGAVSENAAYSGPTDPNDSRNFVTLDPKETIKRLEYSMMYEDEASDWGHRDNILDPEHQYVNIGIAFTSTRLAFIQHFEEAYMKFTAVPTLSNGKLTMSADTDAGIGEIYAVDIYFDSTPVPLTNGELMAKPHFYNVGEQTDPVLHIIPPLPPNFRYTNLGPNALIAQKWDLTRGSFSMSADVGSRLSTPGVYTLLIWAEGVKTNLTTYSIFVN